MRVILQTDTGPDIAVDGDSRLARVSIIDGKTGRDCGYMALYGSDKKALIYISDRRRKAGDNRVAYVFAAPLNIEKAMEVTGGGRAVKELLRAARYNDESITVDIENYVIEI